MAKDKSQPFTREQYTTDDSQARYTLINFYDSKSRSHLSYLMTSTIAFVGVLVGSFSLFNLSKMASFIIFIPLIIYFIGRAFYWSLMASKAIVVHIYSREYCIYLNSEYGVKGKFEYSPLIGLMASARDANFGINEYAKLKVWTSSIFYLFYGYRGKVFAFFVGLGILAILIIKNLIFLP